MTYEHMADDVAALLRHLKIEQADVFGYSMGGSVALAIAIRHPEVVRKVAINGSYFGKLEEAFGPESVRQFQNLPAPADFPPQVKDAYAKVAPIRSTSRGWSPRSRSWGWSSRASLART